MSMYLSIQAAIKNSVDWGLKTTDIYLPQSWRLRSPRSMSRLIPAPGGSPLPGLWLMVSLGSCMMDRERCVL